MNYTIENRLNEIDEKIQNAKQLYAEFQKLNGGLGCDKAWKNYQRPLIHAQQFLDEILRTPPECDVQ